MSPSLRDTEAGWAWAQREQGEVAGRADSMLSTLCWSRCAGNVLWSPGCGDRAITEWCECRCRLLADEQRRHAARHSRTAHNLYSAKICYRYHPHYGVTVQLVRYLRRGSAAVVIVRLPDSSQLAMPEWMLKPEVCQELKIEAKPRISTSALLDLCKLIGTQSSAVSGDSRLCAESETGGRDAQQGESDHAARQAPFRRQRALGNAARTGAGTLSNALEGTTDERSQEG
jgi:hypothetical protein